MSFLRIKLKGLENYGVSNVGSHKLIFSAVHVMIADLCFTNLTTACPKKRYRSFLGGKFDEPA